MTMPPPPTLSNLLVYNPLRLAYSVPLLIISLPLLFAGTFLTLDRSRSFPPTHEPLHLPSALHKVKRQWRMMFGLRGGVGGLLGGYIFGLQLSTFLSLMIPAVSTSAPLSSNSFSAVWILSSIITTILGGRYRYCAISFSALSGGASWALAISVIVHPPLLARQVFVPLISILLTTLTLFFCIPRFDRFLHPTLRVATASSSSFGLVVAIALLSHNNAWANIWERLWVKNGDGWGTSKETGLSVAFCIFVCVGIATDWALRRWLGECPDEKWDSYLSTYAANLPNDPLRAGSFQPLPHSFLGRLLYPSPKDDIFFPSTSSRSIQPHRDSITKDTAALLPDGYMMDPPKTVTPDAGLTSPGFLKKSRSSKLPFATPKKAKNFKKTTTGRKQPVKFRANTDSDSSDDESGTVTSPDIANHKIMPWLRQDSSPNSSVPTLVETPGSVRTRESDFGSQSRSRKELARAGALDYSDYEEDFGVSRQPPEPGSIPNFIKNHTFEGTMSASSRVSSTNKEDFAPGPLAAVPATPSLLKAIDRVSAAQKQAFEARNLSPFTHIPSASSYTRSPTGLRPTPVGHDIRTMGVDDESDDEYEGNVRKPGWDEFWSDVKRKARG